MADNVYIVQRETLVSIADELRAHTGKRVRHGDCLYRVREGKAHTSQAGWEPDVATSLWEAVNVDNVGTADDAIPYVTGMALENGKYYTEDGVTYRYTRDTGDPVYHALNALVGLYIEVVE